jgi:peptidoglycan hydrolase-like protein with peptidoglycan-binding domain
MPDVNEPTLRRHDNSVDGWVEYLQELLKQSVAPDLVIDGDFGVATERAVIEIQKRGGLLVDGVVGNQTWAYLRQEAPQAPSTDGRPAHSYVEQGPEARWWQEHHAARYDASDDTLYLVAVSTGNQPLESGKFQCSVVMTFPDGSQGNSTFDSWTESGEPAGQGDPLFFGGTGLRDQGGAGDYSIEATLPSDLGGDVMTSKFTVA